MAQSRALKISRKLGHKIVSYYNILIKSIDSRGIHHVQAVCSWVNSLTSLV